MWGLLATSYGDGSTRETGDAYLEYYNTPRVSVRGLYGQALHTFFEPQSSRFFSKLGGDKNFDTPGLRSLVARDVTERGEESDSSCKVVDDDADVVQSLDRHVRSKRRPCVAAQADRSRELDVVSRGNAG